MGLPQSREALQQPRPSLRQARSSTLSRILSPLWSAFACRALNYKVMPTISNSQTLCLMMTSGFLWGTGRSGNSGSSSGISQRSEGVQDSVPRTGRQDPSSHHSAKGHVTHPHHRRAIMCLVLEPRGKGNFLDHTGHGALGGSSVASQWSKLGWERGSTAPNNRPGVSISRVTPPSQSITHRVTTPLENVTRQEFLPLLLSP